MANLAHLIFNSWKRVVLKLVSKVFPFKRAEILLLDELDIAFGEIKINQINIPSIPSPHITSDLCPIRPELVKLSLSLEEQELEDISISIKEGMSRSQIEASDFLFDNPKLSELNIQFERPEIDDLTTWLRQHPDWCETTEYRKEEESHRCFEEEETSHKEDDTQRKAEEESKKEVEKKTKEEGHLKEEANRKRVEPIKRGGRSRTSTQDSEKHKVEETESRHPKPEIVCWKREQQWILAVELPENLRGNSGLVVLQNESTLLEDESSEGCWRLNMACGQVVISCNGDEAVGETEKTEVEIGMENYLLFKLSGRNQSEGRHVKFPSSGSYLVVVPDNWERDDDLSGPPPVTPEPVSVEDYTGHFFILEKDSDRKIAFRTLEGELVLIEPKTSRFELVGTRLNDASEGMGPLFGEKPPQICALDNQAWKDVRTIVVGEEGSGKHRWRTQFSPIPEVMEQDLPSEVAARKGGWYFLRFYNTNDDLLDSLDFRFISALREIRTLQSSPLPSESGHKPVCVEFLHEPGCTIQPADEFARGIQIEREDGKTVLTIPPDPKCDKTPWLVGSKVGSQIEVTILVERLWWAVGEEVRTPPEWKDARFTLSRDDFAAISNKAIWVRFPKPRWTDAVFVGFEQQKSRRYTLKVTENKVVIPLREFGDSEEVGDLTQVHSFKIWIKGDDGLSKGIIAVIPASQSAEKTVTPLPPYWVGFGRKKTAVAKAVLRYGSGYIKVNGRPIDDYFKGTPLKANHFLRRLLELDQIREALSRMEVLITVKGSSPSTSRQTKAVTHALARALISYDSKLKPLLKQAGFGGVRVTKVSSMRSER